MAKTKLAFGEWLPDQPGITGALTDANNCIPVATGYAPLGAEANYSDDAGEQLITTFAGKFAGLSTLFAAGSTNLYKFNSGTLGLDALTTTGYSPTLFWDVTQFGSEVIVANGIEKLQAYSLNVLSETFSDLSAAAPAAKYVTVVRDFVVAANVENYENVVYWSDINDETNWTPGATSQADSQVMADGGDIKGLTGGEYGLVLLEKAIFRMSYIGSPLFFQFDAISRSLGCISSGSVVQYNGLTYFLAEDGFYVCDGQSVKSISAGKIDRWFFDIANTGKLDQMSSTVDPVKRLIIWSFKDNFANTNVLIYNVDFGKWSHGDTTADAISIVITPAVTLEGLDAYSASIDALTVSLDDRQWDGGQSLFAGVQGQKIITFGGTNKQCSIVTNDIDNGRSVITAVRPIIDNGTADISICNRNLLSDAIEFTTAVSTDSEGKASMRVPGRYMRVKAAPVGNAWKTAVGMEVDIVSQGLR